MSGQVQVYIDLVLSAQSHVRAGTVKALGITTKTRLSEFPEIPTLEEQGVNDYEVTSWFGIVARADVPDAVAVRLNAAVDQVLQSRKSATASCQWARSRSAGLLIYSVR